MKTKELCKFKKSLCKNWDFPEKDVDAAYEKYATDFKKFGYGHFLMLKDLVEQKTKNMSKAQRNAYFTSKKIHFNYLYDTSFIAKLLALITSSYFLDNAFSKTNLFVLDTVSSAILSFVTVVLSLILIVLETSKKKEFNKEVFPYLEDNCTFDIEDQAKL